MSEEDKETQKLSKKTKFSPMKIISRLIKLTLVLGVFVFIMLTVLTRIGGSSPILREAVEDILTEKTGYSATIGKLNYMKFYPDIALDMEQIELRRMSGTPEMIEIADAPSISVEKAKIALGFFDVLMGRSRFRQFEIESLAAAPQAITPKALYITKAFIDDQDGPAALKIEGRLGDKEISGQTSLDVKGKPGAQSYGVGDERTASLHIDTLDVRTNMKNTLSGLELNNLEIKNADKPVLNGDIKIKKKTKGWNVKGTLSLEPGKSSISPDINIVPGPELSVTGRLNSAVLNVEDIDASSPLQKAIDKLLSVWEDKEQSGKAVNLSGLKLDLEATLEKTIAQGFEIGRISAPLKIEGDQFSAAPLSGNISGGKLSGRVDLDAREKTAKLKIHAQIKGLDYGALQKRYAEQAQIEGHADMLFELTSTANDAARLADNLKGTIGFISGEGHMRSNILNIWGQGLLNNLLPSFGTEDDLKLNCAVMDLELEDRNLTTKALLVDTQRVTVSGDGQYKIDQDRLDLKLTPKSKDVSIGDLSTAVHLSGPLKDLSVTPSALDIGKKIGGLLLGAVNPAFYAITFVGLNLDDQHPCKAFVIEKENLPPPEDKAQEETKDEQPAPEGEQAQPPQSTLNE
ncbi:MAG: AsmA family protein [Alphaproteobacteria bacterium]|nr:AsmA family protein [Alphaproteobacteria bacterium]